MSVKNKRKYLFVFIVILSYLLLITNTSALDIKRPDYKLVIEDNAELLTSEEETMLKEDMQPMIAYGNIAFKSINENEKTTKEYIEEYYEEHFQDDSGTVFLIDVANKEIYIYSAGNNYQTITDEAAERIVNAVAPQVTNQEYYSASSRVYQLLYTYFTKDTIEIESEEGYKAIIEDDAKLLTEKEKDQLKDKMKDLTKYGNIIFKSILTNSTTAPAYARDYYHSKFQKESGTVFLIDMDNRIIYIFSDGSNYNIINKRKAEIITDNIYQYASNKNYFDCAYNAFDQMETLLEGGKILEPMRHISNIVVSIVIAFFITFIIVWQKTKIKEASKKAVLENCDINFEIKDVYGSKTGTHREYSPIDTDSGGSSGGGGGFSGGGSSGGGGGHSF